ncbi:MAG: LytTR family DNA-binding domain-containing protein [Bacteroidota bacterium]
MRILIVEDEASIARRTERLLRELLGEELQQLHIRPSVQTALTYIAEHPIDLLLLDLNLSGRDGFEVLQSLLAESFDTIIISAYRDRAIDAFEYGVLDFVPKPFGIERLRRAIDRYRHQSGRAVQPMRRLAIKKQGKISLIEVANICFIKGANIYSEIHLRGGGKALSDKSLEALLRLLPTHFERVHKSYIVDMQHCQEIIIQPGSKYQLRLDDEQLIPLGRTRYKAIKEQYFKT